MKIGIIGKFGPEEMGKYISNALKKLGHEVYEYEFGLKLDQTNNNNYSNIFYKVKRKLFEISLISSSKSREKVLKNFLSNIEKNGKMDLIISTHDYLTYLEINKLKKITKAQIVLWFPDSLSSIGRAFFMTAGYDVLFFKCKNIVSQLKKYYEMNVFYLPEACEKQISMIKDNLEYKKIDIAIAGNLHSSRLPVIEKLVKLKKYKIKIYGTGAPFYLPVSKELKKCFTGKYIVGNDKKELFKNAKINLNTLYMGEVSGVNVRTFEIAGAGGFQLMSYRKEIEELFDIGKELDTFDSFSELVKKIDYYLANEKKRKEMAEKAYKKSFENYTYESRINEIIQICKNQKQGDNIEERSINNIS